MEELMKKKNYYFILVFLTLLFVPITSQSTTSKAFTQTGKCGKNAYWKFVPSSKKLFIWGTGAIDQTIEIDTNTLGPYKENSYVNIIIKEGITSIKMGTKTYGSSKNRGISVFQNIGWFPIKNLKCPDSLKTLSFGALYNQDIDNIYLGKNLSKIEDGAFYFCHLNNIYISSKNKHFIVKNHTIYTKDLRTLVCSKQLAKIKNLNFTIPNTVRTIRPLAFAHEASLKKVILPKNLRSIGGGAFFRCINLQNVNLTSKTKIKKLPDFDLRKYHIIRDNQLSLAYTSDSEEYPDLKYNANKDRNYFLGTFENCPLSSVTIPDQVVSLSSETFANGDDEFHVSPIGKIHFGKYFKGAINTRNIFEYSPNSCTLYSVQPNKITVAKENKKYCVKDNILYSKDQSILYYAGHAPLKKISKTKKVTISKKVHRIANGAFYDYYLYAADKGIKNVTLTFKGNIEYIGFMAFEYPSSLKKIVFEKNVNYVANHAFHSTTIREIICKGTMSHIQPYSIENSSIEYLKKYPKEMQEVIMARKTHIAQFH